MSTAEKIAFCIAGAALVAFVLWHSARAYLLVSDTAYYWRRGYRLRFAWHRAKQTIH